MRALTVDGGRLVVAERPVPAPVADQVLVRVHGAGLNRADLLQVAGVYPPPPGAPPDVPGLEFAGVVEAAGPGVHALHPGDRVFGIVGGGGQAEYVLTVEGHCARVPDGVDLVDAGGVPEAFVTAHDALFTQACLHPGETVLVHAVGSGVGLAVVQLASCIGATVIGTSRTPEKLAQAEAYGLAHGVAVGRELDVGAVAEEIRALVGGVDVVIDLVGGDRLGVDVAVAATRGRIVIVGLLAGARSTLDMGQLLAKRLTVRGTVLRSRPSHEKAAATHSFAGLVVPLLAAGSVRPVVARRFRLEEAEAAYALLGSDTVFGKLVLDLAP